MEGKPKTAGKRTISLPTFSLDMLKPLHVRQAEAKKEAAEYWEDRDLVFPNLVGGYLHPNHMGDMFRKLLSDAGLPAMYFHDMRHSDITITLRVYGHLFPSMQEKVVETWDDVFGSAKL